MADVNIEEIVIGFLDANKSTGWYVYGDMPKTRPTGFVLVDRTGGPREYIVQDRAEIVVEVYHKTSRESASDEANRIADILKNLESLEPVMRAKVTSLVKLDDLLGQYWRYQIYCDVFYRRDVSTDGIIYPVIPNGGVTSVNSKIGAVVIAAGNDINIDNSGATIVISSTKVSDVQSVNGQTGVVVLDADDIDDSSTTNKFTTAADISKLAGIEAGADVTDATNVASAGAYMKATDNAGDVAFDGTTLGLVATDVQGAVDELGISAGGAISSKIDYTETDTTSIDFVIDEDDMVSNSATKVPTQQSTKAYVDTTMYDVNGPFNPTDATSVFVSASVTALAEGRNFIKVAPGYYNCPGMTSDDMGDVYIVGDGVTFTSTTYVASFSHNDYITRNFKASNEGIKRGAIAFELDDALMSHWTMVFPWSKRMNVPIGAVWHEGQVSAPWIKEAWRHGWEIISHGYSEESFTAITVAEAEAQAVASLDLIEAITGTRENVSFVYPQHHRNATLDSALSKYFTRGRGVASWAIKPSEGGDTWLTSSALLDPEITAGTLTQKVKDALNAVASSNGRLVMYFHGDTGNLAVRLEAMTKIVNYARGLGIHIDKPSAVNGVSSISPDPYIKTATEWVPIASATTLFSRDTTHTYGGSTHSYKATSVGAWGNQDLAYRDYIPLARKNGCFTVIRGSFRVHAPTGGTVSSGSGFLFRLGGEVRNLDGTYTYPGLKEMSGRYPTSGTAIPTQTWERVARTLVFGADITQIKPYITLWNLNATSNSMWVSDIRFDVMDFAPTISFTATLNGTTGVAIRSGIYAVNRYAITVTPKASVAGRLYVETDTADKITVKSTDAADTASVTVVVHAGGTSSDYTWLTTGA